MVVEFISNNVSFFLFILFLTLFLVWKRKNLVVNGSFPFLYMLMYRTSLGLGRMKSWSKKHPRVFLYLAYLSAFIGVAGAILIFVFMFWQLHFIIDQDLTTGGGLVLPIKTESGLDSAVPVFYVPFWYWIIALFILAIVHEFAHGVIAERFKVRIKSSGFAFLGIIAPILPAAFVEPDEKQLAKKPRWQQIAVFGAGSTSNFIFGILFFLVWLFAIGPLIDNTLTVGEIKFNDVLNDSSLREYNVSSGSIYSFNGVDNKEDIFTEITNLSINETYNLTLISEGVTTTYSIKTFENPQVEGRAMIGISGLEFTYANKEGFDFVGLLPLQLERLFFYIWFLNIAIGLMNLLPIWITDGGQVAKTIFSKYFKESTAASLYNFVSLISLVLIIFTVWPSLLINIISLF